MLLDKYNLLSYKSLIDPETKWYWLGLDDKMVTFMNTGVDLILGLNNLLAQVVDYGLEKLYGLSVFDNKVSEIFTTTSSLWTTVYDTFKILFFSIAMFYVVKDFMTKGIQQAFIRLLIFISIFGFNSVFFSQGDYYLKQVNGVSNLIQEEVVDIALIGVNDTNVSLIDTKSKEYQELSATDKMREAFFSVAVFKPFALINFGNQSTDMKEKDFNQYLVKNKVKYNKKEQDRITENIKNNSENNDYLTTKTIGSKYAIAIGSLINTLFFGLIIFFLTLLKLILEIIVLGLCLLLPITGMLSLLPPFQNAIFKALGMIVGLFSVKIISGLGIALVFLFVGIVDSIIPPTTIVGFFAGLIVKALLILVIWKKRDWLFKFITGGRVNTTNKFTRKVDQKMNAFGKNSVQKVGETMGAVKDGTGQFFSKQADTVKERVEDSGSAIRDQAIVNAAQNMKDTEFREPLPLEDSGVIYMGYEADGNVDRKEVSEEYGVNSTGMNEDKTTLYSTLPDGSGNFDGSYEEFPEFEEDEQENRLDQSMYMYRNYEPLEEEIPLPSIELPDQEIEQEIVVDSFVNQEDLPVFPSFDDVKVDQQLDIEQVVTVSTESDSSLQVEPPLPEHNQPDSTIDGGESFENL